jgi:hypothetical protein
MAVTQTDVDRLKAAATSPEKSVTLADGRRVEWRDAGELLKLIGWAEDEVAAASAAGVVSVSHASFSRD